MKILILLTGVALGLILAGECSSMGTNPSKEKVKKFKNSKNYNIKKEEFTNRKPNIIDEMWDRNLNFKNIIDFLKGGENLVPSKSLPEVKPDLAEFLKPSSDLKAIWFGHSSIILNMDGTVVLVDPVFSSSAAPVSFVSKRFQPPVLKLNELPEIDYVLISHDHYDHLDMESIKHFIDKKANFVTPLGVGSHLEGWGIQTERIVEKDWWETAEFNGVKFIATPAQHFSGRGICDRNKTLWASWVIQSENHNIYFSGDSGYDIHFKDIGDKYGPFDVAFLESGQYNEQWREVHMFPEDAALAYKDLKAKKFFPIHWGMFVLSKHPWNDPAKQLHILSKTHQIDLVVPKLGQLVNFSDEIQLNEWWNLATVPGFGVYPASSMP